MMLSYSIRRFLAIISVIGTVTIVNVNAFSVGSTSNDNNNSSARSSSVNSIGDDGGVEPQLQQEQTERNFIEITSLNVQAQSLPASFIDNWPTWVLETDGSLERIPDSSDEDNGFVTPTSIDSLWQPIDLIRPKMKLALGIHIRNGSIRHVFPALDISYDGNQHRNRGMCSVPRALYMGKSNSDNEDENENDNDDENDDEGKAETEKWEQLLSSSSISDTEIMSKAIERAVICLAENDSSINDLDGSHIFHVILNDNDNDNDATTVEIPKSNHELKVTMVEKWGNSNKIENESVDEVEVGILQVNVMTTMSGSESDYLPDVYKPLYNDESLRNPLYKNYKKRVQKTKQAQAEAAAEEVQQAQKKQQQDSTEEL
ncbi:hypothetical protein FRACYDRAFT_267567 [Fragilariopsis cylindrus CCMP1102]|uniref:Uncharacterized protein n=1 Tax=Fragilariopsis cylindrus CCMP1102 TaxID=635003 RepID=A0A1E7FZP3_9STRA|nr:hypothetical protein FRACYDRAFT_267567 [Fragilariopsis cylindrus CCMP1102]|eukprot:OEU23620.1 hypothetical protein FRACYDRAFT_267567 [Fragilariopsis cylindrus CCMP1102]